MVKKKGVRLIIQARQKMGLLLFYTLSPLPELLDYLWGKNKIEVQVRPSFMMVNMFLKLASLIYYKYFKNTMTWIHLIDN